MKLHLSDQPNSDLPPLDTLLKRLVSEPLPPVPGNLESRVWREIRARRSRPAGLIALLAGQGRWSPALAAVAVALCVGVVMGRADSRIASGPLNPSRTQIGDSLGLAVFSAEPPAMPSTLLARLP